MRIFGKVIICTSRSDRPLQTGMYRELMPVSFDVDIICWSTSVIGNSSRKVYSIKKAK